MTAQWRSICPRPNLGPEQIVAEVGIGVPCIVVIEAQVLKVCVGKSRIPGFRWVPQLARQKTVDRIWQVAQQLQGSAIPGLDPSTSLVRSLGVKKSQEAAGTAGIRGALNLVTKAPSATILFNESMGYLFAAMPLTITLTVQIISLFSQ
ncbi:hypothetical protein N7523_007582 [Penicillium sp. IBT 18751x]|nr:hypothetical protein N7523_007582 [Penicillium sp. IBT 18751x]